MLYLNRINFSEGVDIDKTMASKDCDTCHYWYFLNYSFRFQSNVCNRCNDFFKMISMNLSNITILNIKLSDYGCINSLIN